MTDEQAAALKALETDYYDPHLEAKLTKRHRAFLLGIRNEYLTAHPDEVRTIRITRESFNVNVRGIMDLADVASAGKFTIA
jgi:hypothetical protein